MNRTAVIVLEGVLQAYNGQAPIPAGILLYHGLKTTFNLALVTDVTDEEKAKYWCDLHGFKEHSYLFTPSVTDPSPSVGRRMAQLGRIRQAGCNIDLLIEPDPAVAASALKSGVTVLNYLHPLYAKPEFRPDYTGGFKPRAWAEIEDEVQRQENLRAADSRLTENL